jgi:DNA-binding transcriptional ArsR family regulator
MVSSDDRPETGKAGGTGPADPARLERLEHQVADLSEMIAALRRAQPPAGEPVVRHAAGQESHRPGAGSPAEDTLTYSGNVSAGDARMIVNRRRTYGDVVNADPNVAGRVFAALASPARITLLKTLLDGPRTTQQLRGVLDDPSVGQLYHHLKELLAAGLVVQPGRSMYAIRRGSQVEVCIMILAATGLASGGSSYPAPDPEQPTPP